MGAGDVAILVERDRFTRESAFRRQVRDLDARADLGPTHDRAAAYPEFPTSFPAAERVTTACSPDGGRPPARKAVVVEEKLDGANVVVWLEGDRRRVRAPGGPGGQDRARQLGRFAPGSRSATTVRDQCSSADARSTPSGSISPTRRYDRLPAYLVGLDLWSPSGGFVAMDERNRRSRSAGFRAARALVRHLGRCGTRSKR